MVKKFLRPSTHFSTVLNIYVSCCSFCRNRELGRGEVRSFCFWGGKQTLELVWGHSLSLSIRWPRPPGEPLHAGHASAKVGREDIDRQLGPTSLSCLSSCGGFPGGGAAAARPKSRGCTQRSLFESESERHEYKKWWNSSCGASPASPASPMHHY